jgi:hypothetical protein
MKCCHCKKEDATVDVDDKFPSCNSCYIRAKAFVEMIKWAIIESDIKTFWDDSNFINK